MAPEDLAHVVPQLMPRNGTAEAEALHSEEHQASSNAVELPESEMARLRTMQLRNARLFAAQKRKVQPHSLWVVHMRDGVLALHAHLFRSSFSIAIPCSYGL